MKIKTGEIVDKNKDKNVVSSVKLSKGTRVGTLKLTVNGEEQDSVPIRGLGGGSSTVIGSSVDTQALWDAINKKVDVDFFKNLFTVYDSSDIEIATNTYTRKPDNLKISVGTWTEEYLSALGKNSEGGGGGGGVGTVTGIALGTDTTPIYPDDDTGIVTLPAYPTKVSQLVNDRGFVTSSTLNNYVTSSYLANNFYTKAQADNKYMTIAAFENLFNALDSNGDKINHPYSSGVDSIKALVGLWTEQYLSALGLNSEGGGGGTGTVTAIEVAPNVYRDPDDDGIIHMIGDVVTSTERIKWNAAAANSHTHSNKAALDTIDASKIANWNNVATIMTPDGTPTISRWPEVVSFLSGYTTSDSLSSLLANKVDVRFFNNIFTVYDGNGNAIVPNTYTQVADNLKILVGTWTEEYLSALGKNSEGGSGGTGDVSHIKISSNPDVYLDPVEGIIDMSSYAATWNNKQNTITDLATIRSNASHGNTAYSWGNHANAGYALASNTVSDVAYNTTSKKLTKTINGNTTDIVTAAAIVTDGGGAKASTTITAGNGLTGGGDLSSNRTINVVSANAAITVNADNIKLNVINDYTTTTNNTIIPLAAARGKDLNDRLAVLESWFEEDADGNIKTKDMSNGTHRGFYTESFVSALGLNGESGGGTGDVSHIKIGTNPDVFLDPDADGIIDMSSYAANWNDAYNKRHTHSNKSVLDGITSTKVSHWDAVYGVVPSAAYETGNSLADKNFVNSSISTSTATFRGTNTTATTESAFLTWANGLTHDLNDYVFWSTKDSAGNTIYKRYKYDGSQWVFEYDLNNSSFTSDQWGAINSGITSTHVSKLNGIASGAQVNVIESVKVNGKALTITSKAVDITAVPLTIITGADDLKAIEGLSGTGFLKRTGNNTWALDTTVVLSTRKVSTGNGLQGGGDLSADRTISILLPTNSGLSVASTGLKLDIVNNLTTASDYRAISATQAKKIWDLLNQMFTLEGAGTTASPYVIKANYGLYTNQFLSALGQNSQGGGGGDFSEEQMWAALQANSGTYENAKINWNHIPLATTSTAGAIKVGSTLAISNGILNQATIPNLIADVYTKVTVDTYGRVTQGGDLLADDIPTLSMSKISGLSTALGNVYTKTESDAKYVTALGTSGNNLTYTKNGSVNNIRIPFATSAGSAAYANYIIYRDTRNVAETPTEAAAYNGVRLDFKTKTNGVGVGNYNGILTLDPYSDVSGGYPIQLGFVSSPLDSDNTSKLYLRTPKTADTWNNWRTILDTSNTSLSNGVININGNTITPLTAASNLAWSKVTGTPTTLSGYGITDAYTKTEADNKYVTIATAQTITGAKTFSSTTYFNNDLRIANNRFIYWKDANGKELAAISINNSNSFSLGYGTSVAGYPTRICGNSIDLKYGTAQTTGLTLTSSGDVSLYGNLYLQTNNKALYLKNNPSSGTATDLRALFLNASNQFAIGFDMAKAGYNTNLQGNNLYFSYGTTPTIGMILSSEGNLGVGIASPSTKLYVYNTLDQWTFRAYGAYNGSYTSLYASHPQGHGMMLGSTSTSASTYLANIRYGITGAGGSGGTAALYIRGDGKIAVKHQAPSYQLDINGTVGIADAITLYGSSVSNRRIYFGDSSHYLELDANGYFHFSHGLYSDSFVSALGANDEGGGSSDFSEELMWQALQSNTGTYANTKINVGHIPNLDASIITSGTFNASRIPLATSSARGGVKVGYTTNGKNYAVQLSNEQMYVNVPWTDHYAWDDITGKPSSFTPSAHNHSHIVTQGDNRSIATTPDGYSNIMIFRGLKSNSVIDSPSTDTFSYLIGLRGWANSSGGDSHELSFNNSGIYRRQGATTTWGDWYKLLDSGNYSSYALPRSGGTITGALTISATNDCKIVLDNTDSETNYSWISFRQNGVEYGKLGTTLNSTVLQWNSNPILHTGNTYVSSGKGYIASAEITLVSNATKATATEDYRSGSGGFFGSCQNGLGSTYKGALVYAYGSNPILFYIDGAEKMRIASNGNVGIGTTSPAYKLDVNGTLGVTGATTLSSTLNVTSTIAAGGNISVTKSTTSDTEVKVTNSNGSVGIITSTHRGVYDYTKSTWIVGTNGTNTWLSQGNVGIGTTSPSKKLDVNGTLNASGAVTFGSTLGVTGATTLTGLLTANGNIKTGTSNGAYIQIGAIKLVYDSTNNALKVIKSDDSSANFYATGAVSALGANSSGGGSGTFDEDSMWAALGTTSTAKVIASSHIPNLAASKITSGTLAAARIPVATASAVGGIKVGTTLAISDGVLNQKSGIATAGTYRSVTVDTYGRVTAGTNPTTLSGYGITNAYTKTEVDNALSGYLTINGGAYINRKTYGLDGKTAVRITFNSVNGGIISARVTKQRGSLVLIGNGYGDGGTTRNNWVQISESTSYFSWCIPTATGIEKSVEIYNNDTTTASIVVASFDTDVTFTELSALSTTASTVKVAYASSLDDYLPLSGGTLTGVLKVNNITASNSAGLLSYHPSDWTGVSNTQWGVGAADSQGVIRSGNYNLLHYNASTGTSSTILDTNNTNVVNGVGYINGNAITTISGNAATATKATQDGSGRTITSTYLTDIGINSNNNLTQTKNGTASVVGNLLERNHTVKYNLSAVGWYRIGTFMNTLNQGNVCFLFVRREYNSQNNESYIFAITTGYSGAITISQLAGQANVHQMTKIRVDYVNNTSTKPAIDIYMSTANQNDYAFTIIGSAQLSNTATLNPTLIGSQYEYSTVSGMGTSRNFTAVGEVTASSDARLKTIVGDATLSLKDIANAPNVLFRWNDGRDDKVHGGSIAQYWLQKASQFVCGEENGFYSLNYGALALCSAITIAREVLKHSDEIDRLKQEVSYLKAKVAELEERRVA